MSLVAIPQGLYTKGSFSDVIGSKQICQATKYCFEQMAIGYGCSGCVLKECMTLATPLLAQSK
jgi:hypothetical protein